VSRTQPTQPISPDRNRANQGGGGGEGRPSSGSAEEGESGRSSELGPDGRRRPVVGRRRQGSAAAPAARGGCGGRGGRHHVCGSLWQEVLLHLRRRAPPAVPSISSLFPSSPGGQEGPPFPAPTPGDAPATAPLPLPRYGSPGPPSVIVSPIPFSFLVGRMARCGLGHHFEWIS
jgi:hypothetical protein